MMKKQLKHCWLLILVAILLSSSGSLFAQTPTMLGTEAVNGTYQSYALTDLCSFSQVRLQATSTGGGGSGLAGARKWEFYTNGYADNWRPYAAGLTISGFNQQILPVAGTASGLYNGSFGGQSGLLPNITLGNYYTFNIEDGAGPINHNMSVLETSYDPRTITSVVQQTTVSCTQQNIAVTLSSPINVGEYVYIRYTTDNFATSTIVSVTIPVSGTTGVAVIPSFLSGTVVRYYAFTSNVIGVTHTNADMLTLSISNNACANFTYTVPAPPMPIITGSTAICTGGTATLSATTSAPGSGTLAAYQWLNGPTFPTNNITGQINPTYIATAAGNYYVRVTNSNGCSTLSAATAVIASPVPAAPIAGAPVVYCQNNSANPAAAAVAPLANAPIGTNTLRWYTQAVGGAFTTTNPIPNVSVLGYIPVWVSEVNAAGCESPRTKIDITIKALPQITYSTGCRYAVATVIGCGADAIAAIEWLDAGGAVVTTGVTTDLTKGTTQIVCNPGTYTVRATCGTTTNCATTTTNIVVAP